VWGATQKLLGGVYISRSRALSRSGGAVCKSGSALNLAVKTRRFHEDVRRSSLRIC